MAKKYSYKELKERARQKAIEWQEWECNNPVSWGGVAIATNYLERLGKRYGLTREFRENGII